MSILDEVENDEGVDAEETGQATSTDDGEAIPTRIDCRSRR